MHPAIKSFALERPAILGVPTESRFLARPQLLTRV
jgi:hypothetical protein